jgi:hypothetical protein
VSKGPNERQIVLVGCKMGGPSVQTYCPGPLVLSPATWLQKSHVGVILLHMYLKFLLNQPDIKWDSGHKVWLG